MPHSQDQFVNEMHPLDQIHIKEEPISDVDKDDDLENEDDDVDEEIIYELTSEDGYRAASSDVNKLWWQVLEAVKEARMLHGMPTLPSSHLGKQKMDLLCFLKCIQPESSDRDMITKNIGRNA